jgi:hypothetical protein
MPIEEVMPKELYFLFEIDCGMLQPENKNKYPIFFYEQGEALILDKGINITIKDKNSTSWTITANEQLAKFNLSSEEL